MKPLVGKNVQIYTTFPPTYYKDEVLDDHNKPRGVFNEVSNKENIIDGLVKEDNDSHLVVEKLKRGNIHTYVVSREHIVTIEYKKRTEEAKQKDIERGKKIKRRREKNRLAE